MNNQFLERRVREMKERTENSPDGILRTPANEDRLNALCKRALGGKDGDELMGYIRSITTDLVLPPTATDAELRAQEGMRRLAGILDTRRRAEPTPEKK